MFTPEDKSSEDAFTLAHDEFLPSSKDRVLTIKSNTKAYRFKVLTDRRTSGGDTGLRDLTEAIAKVR